MVRILHSGRYPPNTALFGLTKHWGFVGRPTTKTLIGPNTVGRTYWSYLAGLVVGSQRLLAEAAFRYRLSESFLKRSLPAKGPYEPQSRRDGCFYVLNCGCPNSRSPTISSLY